MTTNASETLRKRVSISDQPLTKQELVGFSQWLREGRFASTSISLAHIPGDGPEGIASIFRISLEAEVSDEQLERLKAIFSPARIRVRGNVESSTGSPDRQTWLSDFEAGRIPISRLRLNSIAERSRRPIPLSADLGSNSNSPVDLGVELKKSL